MPLAGGDAVLYPGFLGDAEGDDLFRHLRDHAAWRQERLRLYGKWVDVPRLTAWHGDEGRAYAYSGIEMRAEPWLPVLLSLKARIERTAEADFNSVLLNCYRDGRDSVGWHSDDEPELGEAPVIGSLSLGAPRTFKFRPRRRELPVVDVDLPHGSLLVMRGATQRNWAHAVPKTRAPAGPRINLTFRKIL